uniref:Phosphatidylinositol phosphatase PTPRQ n=1 Tax=Schistocephalus solidus TaxID=70667 RepID=A0A0X3Q1M7_SCHSO
MLTLYPISILLLIHIACACKSASPDPNPRNLAIVSKNSTALTLSWQPPEKPEVGTRTYMVRLNSEFVQKTDKTEVTLTNLQPSAEYKVSVLTMIGNENFELPGIKLLVKMADTGKFCFFISHL